MLDINKEEVDFLVTSNMVEEVKTVINRDFPKIDKIIFESLRRKINRVYFVACGSPLCACDTAKFIFDKYSKIPCETYSGWDFLDHPPHELNKRSLVVAVSDSGETEEVANALEKAKEKGALTVGFSKKEEDTLLSEIPEYLIAYQADCIWEVHLLLTYYISIQYILCFNDNEDLKQILADFNKLPRVLEDLVNNVEENSKKLAEKATEWSFIYTVGAGPLLPLTYKEGIITMLEFTWTHGSYLNAAEFRHGPLEVVEEGVPYIFLLGTDSSRHTTERALKFIKKLTDDYIVFDYQEISHGLHPLLAPFVLFVPLEYFYYYLSINKDHNPDDRRYYGGLMEY